MPPNCKSERRPHEEAVSEVIGFLITFSIIAIILIGAMLAFGQAQDRAEGRVSAIQMDSIAQRVAGVVVEAALFVEEQGVASTTLNLLIELPNDLQGNGYQVELGAGVVTVSSSRGEATQSLFGVGAANPSLCPGSSASGGNLYVVYSPSLGCLGLSNSPVS